MSQKDFMNNNLIIIPARAGSKGVPYKNKILVSGKPLIQYSIDVAKESKCANKIIVTTDDPDIIEIAKKYSIEPIHRPEYLCTDDSPIIDTLRYILNILEMRESYEAKSVVLLQPTAPIRTAKDVDNCINLFYKYNGIPVVSVTKCEDNHPARMYKKNGDQLEPLMESYSNIRRQELPDIFHRNGCIYVFSRDQIYSSSLIPSKVIPYEMNASSSINIDSKLDLLLLEAYLSSNEHFN